MDTRTGRNLIAADAAWPFDAYIYESGQFGDKEWLHLFRMLLTSVLEGRKLDELTVESAKELLKERET